MGFLAATDDADWAVLFAHGQTRRYPAGAQVVGAGEADRALYLVLEGELTTQGRQIENHYPGAILGERGFLEGRPFGAAVLAVTGCEVFRLGLAEFEVLAAKDPALGRYLLFDLARVLAAQADRLRADQLRLDWLRADR
jgi:CRP-like cAMP-binding protein